MILEVEFENGDFEMIEVKSVSFIGDSVTYSVCCGDAVEHGSYSIFDTHIKSITIHFFGKQQIYTADYLKAKYAADEKRRKLNDN